MATVRERQALCLVCGLELGGGAYFEEPQGQTHVDCHDQHRRRVAPRCVVCAEPVLARYYAADQDDEPKPDDWEPPRLVHAEGDCHQQYRERTADKCAICDGPVLGTYFEVGEGAQKRKVHEGDCYERHREATADRCAVCDGPILGRYYDVKERGRAVKVHAEGSCYADFRS